MRPLTLALAQWLTTPAAAEGLALAATLPLGERTVITTLATLQRTFSVAQAAALLDQARLRQKAIGKFGEWATQMLFTDEALQQATGRAIASYRARRYTNFDAVADLGCGIGGDALALSFDVPQLLALDLDAVRLTFARYNLAIASPHAKADFIEADWTTYCFPSTVTAAFADPARRSDGKRHFSLHTMVPPLSDILAVREQLPNLGVKVMPGVADEEIPPTCEAEWISEAGELKEGVLWFGDLRRGAARSATIIKAGQLHHFADDSTGSLPITLPRTYLYEPDPAIIRATQVTRLGQRLGASQLDPQIAYLTGDDGIETAFARRWPILKHFPFNLKTLNKELRAMNATVIAVKKRGSPIEPEEFRRRLKSSPDGQPVTVFITRHHDNPYCIICGLEIILV